MSFPSIFSPQLSVTHTDIHRKVSVGHSPDYLSDRQWFEVTENYNGWEYDGLGHRMFGYLRVDRGALCYCMSENMPAHPANRHSSYRYVVSYEGAGWVPAHILCTSLPPSPPSVTYNAHTFDRCHERMPFSFADVNEAMDELERILYSPRTKLIASWSSDKDKDGRKVIPFPTLWHHHHLKGKLVSLQLPDKPLHDHTVICVTYLAPSMRWFEHRRRTPGVMRYGDDPLRK